MKKVVQGIQLLPVKACHTVVAGGTSNGAESAVSFPNREFSSILTPLKNLSLVT